MANNNSIQILRTESDSAVKDDANLKKEVLVGQPILDTKNNWLYVGNAQDDDVLKGAVEDLCKETIHPNYEERCLDTEDVINIWMGNIFHAAGDYVKAYKEKNGFPVASNELSIKNSIKGGTASHYYNYFEEKILIKIDFHNQKESILVDDDNDGKGDTVQIRFGFDVLPPDAYVSILKDFKDSAIVEEYPLIISNYTLKIPLVDLSDLLSQTKGFLFLSVYGRGTGSPPPEYTLKSIGLGKNSLIEFSPSNNN